MNKKISKLEINEILKDKEQKELSQKIIYALSNLANYRCYHQERPLTEENDKEERIEKLLKRWKSDYSKHFIIINQNKETFTTKQKLQLKRSFEEVFYIDLLNDILFITLSPETDTEPIKIENNKVFINYWCSHVWVEKWKDTRCQYCPRKMLTQKEAIKLWPDCCFHCQDKIIKELGWAEFIEHKKYNWLKPTSRDLEIAEATDKIEHYLKNKTISIKYETCDNECCSCKYKGRKAIYELQFYSDSFDMYSGIALESILNELEEKLKKLAPNLSK